MNSHQTKQPVRASKTGRFDGTIHVPGDKSISHRALMFALLARGQTHIKGLLRGEDVLRTRDAIDRLGAVIVHDSTEETIIQGRGDAPLKQPSQELDMGNSGTSVRLLMGLVAAHDIVCSFTGDASLSKRPMGRVTHPLTEIGAHVTYNAVQDRLPLTIKGSSKLQPVKMTTPVASAQIKSALILAGIQSEGTHSITETAASRDHTENMLRHFGCEIKTYQNQSGHYVISFKGPQQLTAKDVTVPADPSSAAFLVAASLLADKGAISLQNICMNERRTGFFKVIAQMGAKIEPQNKRIEAGEPIADLQITCGQSLSGVNVDPALVPSMIDEFPILAVLASCAKGTTTMTDLGELRVKESDRLSMMANGLKACGVDLEETADTLTIHGNGKPPKGGAFIETALDHRIAMSFLVLGTATEKPVTIDDATPINTSFPGFIELMNKAGANIEPLDTLKEAAHG